MHEVIPHTAAGLAALPFPVAPLMLWLISWGGGLPSCLFQQPLGSRGWGQMRKALCRLIRSLGKVKIFKNPKKKENVFEKASVQWIEGESKQGLLGHDKS